MSSSRTADKFVIRLPDGMRERVAARAKLAHTSMNTLCIQALEQMLDRDSDEAKAVITLDEKSLDHLLVRLQERLSATRGES